MLRKKWSLLIALCIAWQAVWFVGGWSAALDQSGHGHDLLHTLGVPHHHQQQEESGHKPDHSPLAAAHLAADTSVFSPALVADEIPLPVSVRPASPRDAEDARLLRPYLDGLERPPRLLS